MKNRILVTGILVFLLVIFPKGILVYAEESSSYNATVSVTGDMKKGSNIEIIISTDQIDSLYAADIIFDYDKSLIEMESLEKGDILADKSIECFEVKNGVDNEIGEARLEFSCLGKVNGFSGSGSLIILKGKMLKDGKFHINSKPYLKELDENYNLKLQLVNKDVEEMSFSITTYGLASGEDVGKDYDENIADPEADKTADPSGYGNEVDEIKKSEKTEDNKENGTIEETLNDDNENTKIEDREINSVEQDLTTEKQGKNPLPKIVVTVALIGIIIGGGVYIFKKKRNSKII